MRSDARDRTARLAALLHENGTLTPTEHLPEGLPQEAREDLEATSLEALTADTGGRSCRSSRGWRRPRCWRGGG